MIDLYDSELPKIGKVSQDLNQKWQYLAKRLEGTRDGKKLVDALNIFSDEVRGRFHQIGLIAEVDVGPCYLDQPPVITIVDRVVKQEFDHEKMGWEIQKDIRNK